MSEQVITGLYFFAAFAVWEVIKLVLKKMVEKSDPDNYVTVVQCKQYRADCKAKCVLSSDDFDETLDSLRLEIKTLRTVLAMMLEYDERIPQERKVDILKELNK